MEKRFYSRCMYGNYKRDDFKPSGAFEGKINRSSHFKLKTALVAISVALGAILLCSSLNSCKPEQIIVEKDKLVYVTKDSIVHRDSTVYVPVEVIKDYALDTLVLRTSLAESKSWLDTSSAYLVGEIRNLNAIEYKYIEVDKWHTKDSLVYKEVPVPYEVEVVKTHIPTWSWLCLAWFFITMASIAWGIYKRFFKK